MSIKKQEKYLFNTFFKVMDIGFTIIYILILLMSVVIHELAHGYAAYALGDPTAHLQGRLTLNPIKHLDWFGSVLVPAFLIIAQSPFLLGWAKPVPFNPYNFKRMRRWGGALVAAAGPLSNVALALVTIALGKIITLLVPDPTIALQIIRMTVTLNIALALFNLMPVPPLDGHHILFAILPDRMNHIKNFMRKFSIVFFLIVFLFIWPMISNIIIIASDALWGIFF